MSVFQFAAATSDNGVQCFDSTYAGARAGTGTKALDDVGDTLDGPGQVKFSASSWVVFEYFTAHTTSSLPASGAALVSAHYSIAYDSASGTWLMVGREKDFGAAVDTGDFVAGASLGSLPFLAQAQITSSPPPRIIAGSVELLTRLASAGPIKTLWHSDKTRLNQAPTGDESLSVLTADSDTPPLLQVTTIPSSTLLYVGGASVQLSDGSHAWLQVSGSMVTLMSSNADGTSTSTVGTVATGTSSTQFKLQPAFQTLALARDDSDNLYVIGPQGSAPTSALLAQAWARSGGTWTAKTALPVTVPSYPNGTINNVAARWHATSGSGHLMVVLSHTAGSQKASGVAYATLSCAALLAGSGTALVETAADPSWLGISVASGPAAPTNETGSSLDIASAGTTGAVYLCDDPTRGINGRYVLNTSGGVNSALSGPMDGDGTVTHDADSKMRAVAIGSDRVAFVAGGHISIRSYAGTLFGFNDLPNVGLSSFPTAAVLQATAAWDALYDPASNKIWHYYVDTSAAGTVRRTGFDLSTFQGSGEQTSVSTAAGKTVVAVRVPRRMVDERYVRVDIAYSDGTSTAVYDSFNQAPNPPALATRATFDATKATLFSWTFGDPDPLDTQSAYELVINAASGASAYDSGKVTSAANHTLPASSIANNQSWQWKVRTWDAQNTVGAYSSLGSFSTTSAGVVTVTSPATDNAALKAASLTVTWATVGATQAQARIRVVTTSSGATFADTGFFASTATTILVGGLLSGVEYRIEVTTKDGNGITSSTGTRLVTPQYASPEQPVITASDSGAGYILISVSNPAPQGDEPDISRNDVYRRPAGTMTWTRIARIGRDESYRDYTAASGITYEYKVTGVV